MSILNLFIKLKKVKDNDLELAKIINNFVILVLLSHRRIGSIKTGRSI